ncbi:MAG: DNA polymerase V subunit UmuC, partial [Treponema sp.]
MILHVDANGFYAACERLFRPDLNKKPIAVLSNNDGVTIALNQECKDLGFKRGDIYFKEKETYAQKEVEVFSSNYTLYADICRRLNLLYEEYAEKVEMYSIDESFLYVPDC